MNEDHVIHAEAGYKDGSVGAEALGTGAKIGKSNMLSILGVRFGFSGLKPIVDTSAAKSWTGKFVRVFKRGDSSQAPSSSSSELEYDSAPTR